MHRYNFSGHPVVGFDIAPCVGMNFGTNCNDILVTVREILLSLQGRERLLAGELAEVVLPGLSQVAAILLAEWHGQYGNWPIIRWAVRDDIAKSFVYPSDAIANLNSIRESARVARSA